MIYLARKSNPIIEKLVKENINLSYKEFIEKTKINISCATYSNYRLKLGKKSQKTTPKIVIEYIKKNKNMPYNVLKENVENNFNYVITQDIYRCLTKNNVGDRKNFTKEQIEFLKENRFNSKIVEMFNDKFNTNYKKRSIMDKLAKMGLSVCKEKNKWMKENSNLTYNEFKHLFNDTFNTNYTRRQITSMCTKRKIYCSKATEYAIYLDDNTQKKENIVYVKPGVASSYSKNKTKSNNVELNKIVLKCAMIKSKLNELSHL